MQYKYLLSVIVPVYNVSLFLDDLFNCLNDIKSINYQIIFVNDGSTDDSKEKIVKYCDLNKKAILINKENGGLATARNEGLKHVDSKYVLFLDSDDLINSSLLPSMLEAIEKENADTLCVQERYIKANYKYKTLVNKNFLYKVHTQRERDYIFTELCAEHDIRIQISNRIFKTDIIKKVKNFPNVFINIVAEDIEFEIRYLSICEKILVSQNVFLLYRIRKGSIMHKHFYPKIVSILHAFDNILYGDFSAIVKQYARARNCLNSMNVLFKMSKCKEKIDNRIVKYVYNIYKTTLIDVNKSKLLPWYIHYLNRFSKPFIYLLIKKQLIK